MRRATPSTLTSARAPRAAQSSVLDAGRHALAGRRQRGVAGPQELAGRAVGQAVGCGADVEGAEPHAAARDRDVERRGVAHEGGHEGGGGRRVDLGRAAHLLDAAGVEDRHAVGQLHGLVLVVGDEDRGLAGALVDLAQPAAQVAAHAGVERAEGLVEQQHARLDGERAGQRHALALAARQLRRVAPLQPAELHEVEQRQHAAADLVRRGPPRRGRTRSP